MNPAHLHLLLTHAPVWAAFFGLLLLVLGVLGKSDSLKRLSLWILGAAGLLAIPTFLTGGPAQEQLRNLFPTVPPDAAEQHAEIAVVALGLMLLVASLALAGAVLFQKAKPIPKWFTRLLLVLAICSAAAMAWTANLGAKVRHTEIRGQSTESRPDLH